MSATRTPPVRALTLGVAARHPLGDEEIAQAARCLETAAAAFTRAGYEVQTLRLSTRPVLSDLAGWARNELVDYACCLQKALERVGVGFCSLGPALPADGPDGPAALADMLVGRVTGGGDPRSPATGPANGNASLSASVMVSAPGQALDPTAALGAAEAMLSLAGRTGQGLGNFNFAALGHVGPGTPFFPAAYHTGPASLAVALQGAGVVADALATGAGLAEVEPRVSAALASAARPVVELARRTASDLGARFGGIDLSPAPDLDDSIVAALEAAGGGLFGEPGTLALAAAVTAGVRSTGLPMCGYSGLMLPVMEDRVLAQRWDDGLVGADQLLAWSAVCGTGLDTVPVPGACEAGALAGVICDMASLAARLAKPLSARLLPAPGKAAGERTQFSSPYLVNTLIKPLSGLGAIVLGP